MDCSPSIVDKSACSAVTYHALRFGYQRNRNRLKSFDDAGEGCSRKLGLACFPASTETVAMAYMVVVFPYRGTQPRYRCRWVRVQSTRERIKNVRLGRPPGILCSS